MGSLPDPNRLQTSARRLSSLKKSYPLHSPHAALKGGSTTNYDNARSASAKKPINQVRAFALLAGPVASHRVALLVQERDIDFQPDVGYLREARMTGRCRNR
jgi:hypothetical protein